MKREAGLVERIEFLSLVFHLCPIKASPAIEAGSLILLYVTHGAPLSLSSSFSLLVPAPISFPLSLLGEVLSALFYVSG